MSRTMIISSKSAPSTTVTSSVGSSPTPAQISRYIRATRWGVSFSPPRSVSSPIPSRISRTPSAILSSSKRSVRHARILSVAAAITAWGSPGGDSRPTRPGSGTRCRSRVPAAGTGRRRRRSTSAARHDDEDGHQDGGHHRAADPRQDPPLVGGRPGRRSPERPPRTGGPGRRSPWGPAPGAGPWAR